MTDREMLEKCLAHLDRLVERYAQINAGDRKLHKALKEHLGK